jgi:hypothetical protein
MLNRYNPLLRLVCFVLAAVVLYQVARLIRPRGQALAAFSPGKIQVQPFAPDTNAIPAEVQARIDKIKSSQILGQIVTPPKMMPSLLGIAGRDVFIRSPDGQTGLVQEGEEFGGVKLLRVGTNRVLIQYEGKTNELTVFEGFGSESLLGKEK